ncbi:UNKNOWN [Stylonychia lemnae]|uniref:Uncharacterized protein n=1 Tax=Stylonychia lemnae TaxID=5949 RepID=A0A077ZVG9_STYLE|nr:UNKNOWN [Stylonychia lemnae]|eukprot:CDW72421.1 UNKNOWN [Stylonychia lemnae]
MQKNTAQQKSQEQFTLPRIRGAQPFGAADSYQQNERDEIMNSARNQASEDLNEYVMGERGTTQQQFLYKSILTQSKSTRQVGLNPNLKPSTNQTYSKLFPMYGLWKDDTIFKTTKQEKGTLSRDSIQEELKRMDKSHFKQKFQQKEFMEEMLKAKNMMGKMKK